MTEMTMPETRETRNPNRWKVVVAVIVITIVCCAFILVTGVLFYLGTQGEGPLDFIQEILPPSGRSVTGNWEIFYDWGCTGEYSGPITLIFAPDQTFQVTEGGYTSYGNWDMSGDQVVFIFGEYPNTRYTGTVDPSSTSMQGTMTNRDGGSGCWYGNR